MKFWQYIKLGFKFSVVQVILSIIFSIMFLILKLTNIKMTYTAADLNISTIVLVGIFLIIYAIVNLWIAGILLNKLYKWK